MKLEKILDLFNPKENTLNFVETNKSIYFVLGNVECLARGIAIGGLIGAFFSRWDYDTMVISSAVGGMLDLFQNGLRTLGLTTLKKCKPEEYQKHLKEFYGRIIK